MSKLRKYVALLLSTSLVAVTMSGCNINIHNVKSDKDTGEDQAEEIQEPELESVDFNLSTYDDDENMVFESYGNSYLLTEASAKVYPELNDRLNTIDENEKEIYTQTIEDFGEDAAKFAEEQRENGAEYTYYSYSETALKVGDERVVSLLRTEYGYLGGAHPDYYYQTFNIDTKTGDEILLSDIITDNDALKKLLIDKLNSQYPDGNFFDLEGTFEEYDLDPGPEEDGAYAYTFTMDPAGLTFYFGPYDLNSYADGSQQIDVFYNEIPDILKEGFVYSDYAEEGLGGDVPEKAEENVAGEADEASKDEEAEEAEEEPTYQNLYLKEAKDLVDSDNADNFALYDIDGDGVPELIAVSSEGSWDKDQVFLYTFYNDEIVLLASDIAPGMEGHYIALYDGENLVELSGAATGESHVYYELVEGELNPVLSLQSFDDPSDEDKTVYLVDDDEVSEEEYTEACDDFAAVHGTKTILDLEDQDGVITYMSLEKLADAL